MNFQFKVEMLNSTMRIKSEQNMKEYETTVHNLQMFKI